MLKAMIGLVVVMAAMSGCASNVELLKTVSVTTRSDVFREVTPDVHTPAGYAELTIYSSLKTDKRDAYMFDKSTRGTPDYVLQINIDGQSVRIEGVMKEDNFRKVNDPESGEGVRYTFRKKVWLPSGRHRLIVASPEDGIAMEKEISLVDGTKNYIHLKPHYGGVAGRRKPAIYGSGPSFHNGIKRFDILLNGRLPEDM